MIGMMSDTSVLEYSTDLPGCITLLDLMVAVSRCISALVPRVVVPSLCTESVYSKGAPRGGTLVPQLLVDQPDLSVSIPEEHPCVSVA
jgi:hypothetical protein